MGRRTVLLIVSVLVAALGTSLVFMYVKTADARAAEAYDTRQVLKAVEIIQPGETLAQAQQAGKIAMGTVPNESCSTGALSGTTGLADKVALTTVYPNEQIVAAKFGSRATRRCSPSPTARWRSRSS